MKVSCRESVLERSGCRFASRETLQVDQSAVDEQFGAGGVDGVGSKVEGGCIAALYIIWYKTITYG
jgi:hypothetical protein